MIKIPALAAAFVLTTSSAALAITTADITPAALVGKTLTFTIVNGGSPYPTTGTWSGTFATSGNAFTVANITGDTVPVSTTFSAVIDGIFTDVSLGKFVEGQAPATLSLYALNGIGNYEVFISGVFGVSLNGTFTIGATTAKGPEIDVRFDGTEIQDNTGTKNIGGAIVGKSVSKTFTVENNGNSPLKNLAITIGGKNKSEFTATALKKDQLAVGDSVEFKVTFKPKDFGTRKAIIRIKSNDKDEDPFEIRIKGAGAGIK